MCMPVGSVNWSFYTAFSITLLSLSAGSLLALIIVELRNKRRKREVKYERM